MRFVSICTLFVVVLTMAIHNVSASPVEPVKQGDQVNQGQNDLSKGANATCTFVDDMFFAKEKQDELYKLLTNIDGSNIACQVTNFVSLVSAPISPCTIATVNEKLSDVLDSLRTAAKTPRPNTDSQDKDARISPDEFNTLKTLLPKNGDPLSLKMINGVEHAISSPSSFFKQFPSKDSFYGYVCDSLN